MGLPTGRVSGLKGGRGRGGGRGRAREGTPQLGCRTPGRRRGPQRPAYAQLYGRSTLFTWLLSRPQPPWEGLVPGKRLKGAARQQQVLSRPDQARSKEGTRPWVPGPRAKVGPPGEGGTGSVPGCQAGICTTTALLIRWWGLCGERAKSAWGSWCPLPHHTRSPSLTIGIAP